MDELRALPGVEAASAVQTLPLAGSNSWRGLVVEGIPLEEPDRRQSVGYMQIEDQYFETLDVPVLRGRTFGAADLEENANVVAVNQSFVERYWPQGDDPLGRRAALRLGAAGGRAAAAVAHHRRRGRPTSATRVSRVRRDPRCTCPTPTHPAAA